MAGLVYIIYNFELELSSCMINFIRLRKKSKARNMAFSIYVKETIGANEKLDETKSIKIN